MSYSHSFCAPFLHIRHFCLLIRPGLIDVLLLSLCKKLHYVFVGETDINLVSMCICLHINYLWVRVVSWRSRSVGWFLLPSMRYQFVYFFFDCVSSSSAAAALDRVSDHFPSIHSIVWRVFSSLNLLFWRRSAAWWSNFTKGHGCRWRAKQRKTYLQKLLSADWIKIL